MLGLYLHNGRHSHDEQLHRGVGLTCMDIFGNGHPLRTSNHSESLRSEPKRASHGPPSERAHGVLWTKRCAVLARRITEGHLSELVATHYGNSGPWSNKPDPIPLVLPNSFQMIVSDDRWTSMLASCINRAAMTPWPCSYLASQVSLDIVTEGVMIE